MAEFSGDKKHAPTKRRRDRARSEGQVARSQDLSTAILMATSLATLWMFGGRIVDQLKNHIVESFSLKGYSSGVDQASDQLTRLGINVLIVVSPVILLIFAIGILIHVSQTGFLFLPNKALPSANNLNPLTGLRKIFSASAVARLLFGLGKIAGVCVIAYFAVDHFGPVLSRTSELSITDLGSVLFGSLLGACSWIVAGLICVAVGDYAFQRWYLERQLMMSDEELREEMKEMQVDPVISQRRKETQRRR